jgi:pyrroloquinoline-quinone synthase
VHYKLHSSIDKRHAREFFDIIQAKWGEGVSKYNIKQGIEMGVYIFDRLYKDLYLSAMKHKSESSILA